MSNPSVVPASAPGSYGICLALGQAWNTTTPTWTRLDDPSVAVWGYNPVSGNVNCASAWTSDRGRAYELDKTEAGTATVTCQDPHGWLDPTNPNSPFYGKITPTLPAKISVQNPSNNTYYDIFTGFLESWNWTMTTEENLMILTLNFVDGFEPLARCEIQPDSSGTTVFGGDSASNACKTRIETLLDLANWAVGTAYRTINTGSVTLQETVYNPETSVLSGIQDVADAEFPGVANFFMSKSGQATFYGRYPRFQPTNYPQDVNFWQAGDASAADTFGAARIADIQWNMDQKNLINACLSYPNGVAQNEIYTQLSTDPTSITKYGIRTLSLTDLIVSGQNAGGGISPQPAATALQTCFFYAQYYTMNYSTPQLRISLLEFHSRPSGDSQSWKFLTGVEIGDLVTVFTRNPGGGGFSKETDGQLLSQFFVEGIHYQVAGNLHGNIPEMTMTLDVSPRGWFSYAPWAS